jgi:hypothetical protein
MMWTVCKPQSGRWQGRKLCCQAGFEFFDRTRNTSKDKDSKKIWTRIGAVWPNKSGKGFNISWDYLPLGDGVTVMLPYEKDSGEVSPPVI